MEIISSTLIGFALYSLILMILHTQNISYGYNQQPLFSDLSWMFQKGMNVVFGPSGAGKSTLLYILAGLLPPQKGTVIYKQQNLYQQSPQWIQNYRNNHIGCAFQTFHLLPHFKVKENLRLPTLLHKNKTTSDTTWLNTLIQKLQLTDLTHKQRSQLSGGEQQRVSIIKSLCLSPPIVFLDEPGSYLNKELKEILYEILDEYSQHHCVILVSHDLGLQDRFALHQTHNYQDITLYQQHPPK